MTSGFGLFKNKDYSSTHFLNVDLDIYSMTSLEPLVAALGEDVFVLHVGRSGRRYEAHLETAGSGYRHVPDRTIAELVAMIEKLPARARKLWTTATRREFNIGIQAEKAPASFELQLLPKTVAAVARVNATFVVTVYAPKKRQQRTGRVQ